MGKWDMAPQGLVFHFVAHHWRPKSLCLAMCLVDATDLCFWLKQAKCVPPPPTKIRHGSSHWEGPKGFLRAWDSDKLYNQGLPDPWSSWTAQLPLLICATSVLNFLKQTSLYRKTGSMRLSRTGQGTRICPLTWICPHRSGLNCECANAGWDHHCEPLRPKGNLSI